MADPEPQPPVDPGADPAQPAPAAEPAAATPPEPSLTEPAEPSQDDNLAWLQSKGIDPTDPEAVSKVAEMYRQAEKTMHQSTAKASELEKSLREDVAALPATDGQSDVVQQLAERVQALTVTTDVNAFFSAGGNAELAAERRALEPKMAEIVTENPTLGQLVKQGYMSYDQLAAMAKGSDAGRETALKAEGGKQALEQVASKQQARAIPGNATTSAMAPAVTKANVDSWYAGLSAAERANPETQAIVSNLL